MADINDKFGRPSAAGGYANATTVKSARTPSEPTLACNDLTGWSLDTPVFFVTYKKGVDPVTNEPIITSQKSGKGLVSVDSNTITNLVWADGVVDNGNDVGEFVECLPSSFWGSELISGLLKSHNANGVVRRVESGVGIKFSTANTQPAPDPEAIILWAKPL